MNLAIWALLSLAVSLTAGVIGFSNRFRRAAARTATVAFGLFLAVFMVLVVLVVISGL